MFRRPIVAVGGMVLLAGIIDACGSSPTSSTPATAATVASVSVSGTAPTIGASAQFTATATLSNNTTQSVTSQATWQSSNTAVATVSNAGLVTGVSGGSADITATYQSVTGRVSTTIARPTGQTYTISGTVTDGTSSGVLPNIDIQVTDSAGKTQSTRTGSTGTYTISGVASGTVSVTAAASSYESTTTSVALTADQHVDIVLKRATCTFLVSPSTFSFTPATAQGTVTIKSQAAGCTWMATSNDSFLTIPSGGSGLDNGVVTFSVAANPIHTPFSIPFVPDAPRSGTLTIAGTTVMVRQDAPRLGVGAYDPAFKASVCGDVGEGCTMSGHFSACPAGSVTEPVYQVSQIVVATPDGSPLTAGKSVEIYLLADPVLGRLAVQIGGDAQRPSWSQMSLSILSNTRSVLRTVLPSTSGLQVVRATYGDPSAAAGSGPCGSLDNVDLVFRVQ